MASRRARRKHKDTGTIRRSRAGNFFRENREFLASGLAGIAVGKSLLHFTVRKRGEELDARTAKMERREAELGKGCDKIFRDIGKHGDWGYETMEELEAGINKKAEAGEGKEQIRVQMLSEIYKDDPELADALKNGGMDSLMEHADAHRAFIREMDEYERAYEQISREILIARIISVSSVLVCFPIYLMIVKGRKALEGFMGKRKAGRGPKPGKREKIAEPEPGEEFAGIVLEKASAPAVPKGAGNYVPTTCGGVVGAWPTENSIKHPVSEKRKEKKKTHKRTGAQREAFEELVSGLGKMLEDERLSIKLALSAEKRKGKGEVARLAREPWEIVEYLRELSGSHSYVDGFNVMQALKMLESCGGNPARGAGKGGNGSAGSFPAEGMNFRESTDGYIVSKGFSPREVKLALAHVLGMGPYDAPTGKGGINGSKRVRKTINFLYNEGIIKNGGRRGIRLNQDAASPTSAGTDIIGAAGAWRNAREASGDQK